MSGGLRGRVRAVVGGVTATVWRVRSRGRIQGSRFFLTRPTRVRVSGSGRIEIGPDVIIEAGARITATDAVLRLGTAVFVGQNATITAFSDLSIGEHTLLGENVSLHTEDHGPRGHREHYTSAPITIGADAWLGAGVVVTGGVRIGDGATVGANAVVTKDVPAGATAAGVPARILKAGA
jgi:acetyltransferase-like isoleucine patch superfamily enzyme